MKKNNKLVIFLIILLSILVLVLTGFMISMLNGNFKFTNFHFSHKVSNELVLDEVYDNEFSKINIKTSASDIYVKESNDDKVRVIIYGDKDTTTVESTNNELTIVVKEKNCVGFCFNMTIDQIEIYLPSSNEGILNIKNDYGNVEIGEFLNMDIILDEDCGDVTVLGGKNVNITNDYGDIILNQASVADIKESAGDVEVGTVSDITVENDYGDITIDKVINYLNVSDDCGDIEINDIILNKDSYIKNNFGDIEVGSTNEVYINASTDLGNVKINKNYSKSDVTLKIENDCGDIKVNN